MKLKHIFLAFLGLMIMVACSKPGPGGKASIRVEVKANKFSSPGSFVYLKYDAKTSPGTAPGDYDQVKTSDIQGLVYFTNLQKGDYFIYAVRTDSITISGEKAVEIKEKKEVIDSIIEME